MRECFHCPRNATVGIGPSPRRVGVTGIRRPQTNCDAPTKHTDAGFDAKTIRQETKYGQQRLLGQISEHRFSAPTRFPPSSGIRATTLKPLFEEVSAAVSGLTWRHGNGRSADYFLPETTGAGCAFLDYDNDGWMDIYLVNSGKCDFLTPDPSLGNALYRNNRDGTFTDVTEKAGVAVGDNDGDGWPDLYVTQYGRRRQLSFFT